MINAWHHQYLREHRSKLQRREGVTLVETRLSEHGPQKLGTTERSEKPLAFLTVTFPPSYQNRWILLVQLAIPQNNLRRMCV